MDNTWINAARPHCDFLWVLTETGIVGFLLYFSLFLIPLYFILRHLRKEQNFSKKTPMLTFFFAITGFGIYSIFSFPKERIELQIILNTIFAFVVYEYQKFQHKNIEKKKSNNTKIPYIIIFVLGGLLFAGFASYKRIKTEIGVQKIPKLVKQNKYNDIITIVNEIYSPFSTLDNSANSLMYNKAIAFEKTNAPIDEVINLFHKALQDHPYNILTLNGLAYIHQKNNNLREAEKYCKIALEYSPEDLNLIINHSKIRFVIYGIDSAYTEIQKIDPNTQTNDYKAILNYLLYVKIQNLSKQIHNISLKSKIIKKFDKKDFLINTFIIAQNENEKFEKILLQRALNEMKNLQSVINDNSVLTLIAEYRINMGALNVTPSLDTKINYARIQKNRHESDSTYSVIQNTEPNISKEINRVYLKYLLKIKTLIEKTENTSLKKKLFKIAEDEDFLIAAYNKSLSENENFEKILLQRALSEMKNQQSVIDDNSVQALIKEYQITLK
jgi:tetratricopeptide (TPR) repeat protein